MIKDNILKKETFNTPVRNRSTISKLKKKLYKTELKLIEKSEQFKEIEYDFNNNLSHKNNIILNLNRHIANIESSLSYKLVRSIGRLIDFFFNANTFYGRTYIRFLFFIKSILNRDFLFKIHNFLQKYIFKGRVLREIYSYLCFFVMKINKKIKSNSDPYIYSRLESLSQEEILKQESHAFTYNPLVSIIMPVYNIDRSWLEAAISSVMSQTYKNWELCIADDGSTKTETIEFLKSIENSKIKIKFLEKNGGISYASNEALTLASGEYVVFMDNDDELTSDALFWNIDTIITHNPDVIYSDECVINPDGSIFTTHYKPDFSPDMILSQNYICHLLVIKRDFVMQVNGFRSETDGAQDHDLILRVLSLTNNVYHIPKVLYRWRRLITSTSFSHHNKPRSWKAGIISVRNVLKDRSKKAKVYFGKLPGTYDVRYEIKNNPKVSIIIPFKDNISYLKICLISILEKSIYQNYEIIVVNNNSCEEETFDFIKKFKHSKVTFVDFIEPFNFSKINNFIVKTYATGEHILLLNNDTEVISPDWIERMLSHSQRPEVGVVGCKLYYSNNLVQHAGVIIGIGGIAGHFHKMLDRYDSGYFGRASITQNFSALTGACIMVKKSIYLEQNGLEEKLSVAFNDVDFCLRVFKSGYLNVFTPYAELYHHESISRGYEDTIEKQIRFRKEANFILRNHEDLLKKGDPYYNPNLPLIENLVKRSSLF